MKLDAAFITLISPGINHVWQEIGSALYECAAEQGESLSNAEAIESILDADRLTTMGYKDVDDAIEVAIKEHTYLKVAKFIGKNFQLA